MPLHPQQSLAHILGSRLARRFLSAAAILLPCLLLAGLTSQRAAAQNAAAAADLTQLSMTGDQGDYIGGNTAYSFKPEDGTFGAQASDQTGDGQPDYLTISFNGTGSNGHWWYLNFSTVRLGSNLVPGVYTNAQRAPFADAGHPGIDIFGDGRGCNTITGSFRIHEAVYDPTNPTHVLRFTASFEQHCEGGPSALIGTIYYNYSGSTPSHAITGRLAESNGTGTSGVQVALTGSQTTTATTDAQGNYSFPNLIEGGNFRVVPTQGSNYVITPQATTVKNLPADSTVNFTTVPLYSISGTVKNSSGAAITGALVSLTGSQTGTTTTDNNGAYSFTGLRADGTYTLTPSRTHYGFAPPSSTFNTLPGNQTTDFVGTLLTHTISGRVIDNLGVGISGATVNLSGAQASTTTTDSNGNYSFANLTAGGTYSIAPVMKYLTFSPPSSSFFDLGGNWSNINFTGTRATYALSGVVLDNSGNPMSGVLLTLGGTRSGTTVTNASGNYSFTSLPAGGNYNVSAAKWNYVFNPAARDLNDLSESRTLNYVGTQDAAQFFVRQHYSDFLGREADAAGLAFWTGEINGCGANAACVEVKRVNVSAAFFLSIEFQNTGYLVERMYKVAYGDATENSTGLVVPIIRRDEFMQDTPLIGAGIIVGQGNWQAQLDANKDAYAQTFVQRSRFTNIYNSLSPAEFVDKLNTNAGGVLTDSERTNLVNELTANNTVAGRASVLRKVAENGELDKREKSRAFVLMEYFGYLRRNPNDAPEASLNFAGWKFWFDKLNAFNGNYVSAEMVKAFITSDEYRKRFGQ
jgi:hypothetical protein